MTEAAQPVYDVHIEKHVHIPMSDGRYLDAHLFMPVGEGPFPAVFDYYPYRKDDLSAGNLRIQCYLAQRGFAALRVDVRGTGSSAGVAENEYVLQEQLDGVDAIAWMAEQPWCNGNVGMFGTSYGGFNSLQVAMRRPPALKAICPMYFTDNRYTDDCHYKGGALQMLYDMGAYGLSMVVQNALPPYPEAAGPAWAELWEEHLQAEPWLLRWLENQTFNEFWKHGSLCEDYGAIQCATFLIGGWRDGYTNCNLRTFQHLICPKKLLIGPWLHIRPDQGIPGPRIDHLHEMARFFEYWLKGIDNGIMDEPPITLYVQRFDAPHGDRKMTSGFWRSEAGWPLDRSTDQTHYLTADGKLQAHSPADESVREYTYNPTVGTTFPMFSAGGPMVLPVDQRLESGLALEWTSEPLGEVVEILGYPEVVLNIAATTDIATVAVRLIDVAPDGTAAFITKGVLNLTHRESHEAPSPLAPDEVYAVRIQLDATSWLFEPGHRIRISVAGADFPNTWPSPKPYVGRVTCGGNRASRLILPVVGPQEPALPTPQFRPPTPSEPGIGIETHAEPPIWQVTRDHVAGTVQVYMRTAGQTRLGNGVAFERSGDVTAVASERDPAQATVRGLSQVTLYWPERTIKTVARGQIQSTADTFHVTIQLDITMDEVPYLSRRWVRSIARELL